MDNLPFALGLTLEENFYFPFLTEINSRSEALPDDIKGKAK
jgi:hypothetical protein